MGRRWLTALLASVLAAAMFCLVAGCSGGDGNEGAESGDGVADGGAQAVGEDPDVAALLADMPLEDKVAQLFIVRPESIAPDDGDITVMDDLVRDGLSEHVPGGLCYFAENIETPSQTRALLAGTQEAAMDASGLPLFQAVDEEGGGVARVAGNSSMGVRNVGSASQIGARGDVEEAYDAALYISDYLLDLGFNMDFAPVADIADGVGNAIGSRAFDSSEAGVTPMVEAQVRAFNEAGMLSSAKHFPGIGGTSGDSHDGAIETDKTLEEMEESELVPFRAAIEAGVPMVMVGHVSCPGLTGDDAPASLSREVVTGVLRDELGFDGLIVTDSLEMGAVEDWCAPGEQGVLALAAGCDLVLLPEDYDAAYQGVLDAVAAGELQEGEIDEHVARVLRVKLAMAGEVPSWRGAAR